MKVSQNIFFLSYTLSQLICFLVLCLLSGAVITASLEMENEWRFSPETWACLISDVEVTSNVRICMCVLLQEDKQLLKNSSSDKCSSNVIWRPPDTVSYHVVCFTKMTISVFNNFMVIYRSFIALQVQMQPSQSTMIFVVLKFLMLSVYPSFPHWHSLSH